MYRITTEQSDVMTAAFWMGTCVCSRSNGFRYHGTLAANRCERDFCSVDLHDERLLVFERIILHWPICFHAPERKRAVRCHYGNIDLLVFNSNTHAWNLYKN